MSESTTVPAGHHPAAAAVHHLDLQSEADRLLGELPGYHRRTNTLVREASVSIVMMALEAGDSLQEHSAPGVVIVQALRGRVTLTADGKRIELAPGHITVFQPGVRHDLKAEEKSVVLLTVCGEG